jgi:hypothetical protein
MRSRLLSIVIGLVAGVALTSGAVWANGYRTHVSTDGSGFTTAVADARPEQSYTYAIARVCKEGSAEVKITGVRVSESVNAINVVDFAVAPSTAVGNRVKGDIQAYLDKARTSMTAPPTRNLSTRCSPDHNDLRDVIVEIHIAKEGGLPAAAIQFIIDYTVRGRTKSLTTDNGITFCRGDETDKQANKMIETRKNADQIAHCD